MKNLQQIRPKLRYKRLICPCSLLKLCDYYQYDYNYFFKKKKEKKGKKRKKKVYTWIFLRESNVTSVNVSMSFSWTEEGQNKANESFSSLLRVLKLRLAFLNL